MIGRAFYRLTGLAVRWTCSVEDLIHEGLACRARICVDLWNEALPVGVRVEDRHFAPRVRPANDDDPAFRRFEHAPVMPIGIYELPTLELRQIASTGLPSPVGGGYRCDGLEWMARTFFGVLPQATGHNLCMLPEEVSRLDLLMQGSSGELVDCKPAAVTPLTQASPPSTPRKQPRLRELSDDQEREVVQLYQRDRNISAVAKKFHVSRRTIDRVLIRSGIKSGAN